MTEADLFSIVLNHWGFWIVIIMIIGFFILRLLTDNKKKPEQRPFYGAEVREDITNKAVKKRLEVWGLKGGNIKLKQGLQTLGIVLFFDTFTRKNIKDTTKQNTYYMLGFRKNDLMGRIKSMIGRYEKLLLKPSVISLMDDNAISINPQAYFIHQDGVWILTVEDALSVIDELNTIKDMSNLKGFVSDQPRRIANLEPSHSLAMDRLETEANLARAEKAEKRGIWKRG